MLNSVALDVVIGLVFIYLLYSLLASVLSEIIATNLGMRGRNLKEAIYRMLADEPERDIFGRTRELLVRFVQPPKTDVVNEFYNHPEIKYLGSLGLFKNISSFKAVSFSKTLLNMFTDDHPVTRELLDEKLGANSTSAGGINLTGVYGKKPFALDPTTSKYIRILWADSKGDITRFTFLLEGWFDRTMEQATEWYKRKIQVVLLVIGFAMAWFFNADTFVIIKKLSVDKDAREKMVSMANAYLQNHSRPTEPQTFIVTGATTTPVSDTSASAVALAAARRRQDSLSKVKLDSLLLVKKELEADIKGANDLLGLGGWLPDTLEVKLLGKTNTKNCCTDVCKKDKNCPCPANVRDSLYSIYYDHLFERNEKDIKFKKDGKFATISISRGEKFCYLFLLLVKHFFGFFITAIAISLGAPFWFDLLNKLMRLRSSQKQETDTAQASQQGLTPDKRVG